MVDADEYRRRIQTIPMLWLASYRDASLRYLLMWLLGSPTWDVQAVLNWVVLQQLASNFEMQTRLLQALHAAPAQIRICEICAVRVASFVAETATEKRT